VFCTVTGTVINVSAAAVDGTVAVYVAARTADGAANAAWPDPSITNIAMTRASEAPAGLFI
jgi:hypothetical protein